MNDLMQLKEQRYEQRKKEYGDRYMSMGDLLQYIHDTAMEYDRQDELLKTDGADNFPINFWKP